VTPYLYLILHFLFGVSLIFQPCGWSEWLAVKFWTRIGMYSTSVNARHRFWDLNVQKITLNGHYEAGYKHMKWNEMAQVITGFCEDGSGTCGSVEFRNFLDGTLNRRLFSVLQRLYGVEIMSKNQEGGSNRLYNGKYPSILLERVPWICWDTSLQATRSRVWFPMFFF
jgi:hypothetical protein